MNVATIGTNSFRQSELDIGDKELFTRRVVLSIGIQNRKIAVEGEVICNTESRNIGSVERVNIALQSLVGRPTIIVGQLRPRCMQM